MSESKIIETQAPEGQLRKHETENDVERKNSDAAIFRLSRCFSSSSHPETFPLFPLSLSSHSLRSLQPTFNLKPQRDLVLSDLPEDLIDYIFKIAELHKDEGKEEKRKQKNFLFSPFFCFLPQLSHFPCSTKFREATSETMVTTKK